MFMMVITLKFSNNKVKGKLKFIEPIKERDVNKLGDQLRDLDVLFKPVKPKSRTGDSKSRESRSNNQFINGSRLDHDLGKIDYDLDID